MASPQPPDPIDPSGRSEGGIFPLHGAHSSTGLVPEGLAPLYEERECDSEENDSDSTSSTVEGHELDYDWGFDEDMEEHSSMTADEVVEGQEEWEELQQALEEFRRRNFGYLMSPPPPPNPNTERENRDSLEPLPIHHPQRLRVRSPIMYGEVDREESSSEEEEPPEPETPEEREREGKGPGR